MTVQTAPVPTGLRLGAVLDDLVATVDWASIVRYDVDQRWYGRLEVPELPVEAWLLSWWPGQRTGLHDHGGSAGAFAVVRGRLREDTPAGASAQPHSRTLTASQRRVFGPRHLHDVVNDGPEPAVSIHVYAPRLTTMSRYRWTDRGPEIVSVERAGSDW
ncbi:cysteine dioxygenase [Cryptosporangium phraense]|uniref:Cysteine dioxygenase n=1 Tax=Cryptosporangium phraense TaxID=2593070 RepID=A0A545AQJ1_9ACTN|nr:cysteine dioxygenase family protein [Cryptosporangium phraense]TQS43589.1 cysteine dioxygenase [Cryptosporangium phraense]